MKNYWKEWKRKWLPSLIAHSAKAIIRLILYTCRIHLHGLDTFVKTAQHSPCILMLWHDKLVPIAEILNTYTSDFICTAFISKSRDGDPLALVAESYSRGRVLRVPHNAKHIALNSMIELLKEGKQIVLITPDGPRGPRHVIKPGIIVAAKTSSAKIVPFSWTANRFWQLKTWDRMQIPKPFATIEVTFGSPILLQETDEKSLDEDAEMLRMELEALSMEAIIPKR